MSVATDIALDGGELATAFQLDKTYVDGSAFQYAAEWLRNVEHVYDRMVASGLAVDDVKAQMDFVQVQVLGTDSGDLVADPILRRMWNIGTPMDPKAELLEIYSKLNVGGGENRWSPENLGGSYGMGVRAALLYWTDTMFITTVPGEGSFGIILRQFKDEHGNSVYRIARPVVFDEHGDALPYDDPSLSPNGTLVRLPEDGEDTVYLLAHDGSTAVALTDALVDDEVKAKGGVTLVLLGKGSYTDDVEFDRNREGETSRGVAKFLTNRFVGGQFPVTVQMRIAGAGENAEGRVRQRSLTHTLTGEEVFFDQRVLKTLKDWTSRAVALDPVNIDGNGTFVTPYLLPEDYFHEGSYTKEQVDEQVARTKSGSPKPHFEYRADGTYGRVKKRDEWLPYDGMGQAVVIYKDEMYALRDADEDRAKALSQWGISKTHVARRVLLVIEPRIQTAFGPGKTWGITQNSARSNVQGPNGTALPISTWQTKFVESFPKEIAEALAVRPEGAFKEIPEEEIDRMKNRAFGTKGKSPKRPPVFVKDEAGKDDAAPEDGEIVVSAGGGKGHGGGGPASKTATPAKRSAKTGIKGMARTPRLPDFPQPRFLNPDEWANEGYDEDQLVHISLLGGGYAIELNRGHWVMKVQSEYYWSDEREGYFSQPQRKKVKDKIMRNNGGARTPGAKAKAETAVIGEIEYVYRHDALAFFLGTLAHYTDEKGNVDRALLNTAVTNGSMAPTHALEGLYPQQASIASRLNSLAGAKS
jgi:hypothetical protein